MMELTIAYDDNTRALGEPSSKYGGTTLDVSATKLIITGIPAGLSARLDIDVQVRVEGRAQRVKPYLALELDDTGTTGSCTVPGTIMAAASHGLRLPIQLVLTDGTVTYASRNIVQLDVSPSIGAKESVEDAYGPDISLAFMDVDEEGGVITFTRIDGTQETVHVNDDFVAWTDVLTAWPAGTDDDPITDDTVPSAKLADATFVRIAQSGALRLLITDADGNVTADGPHVATAWNDEPSDDYLPTEKLVKDELDKKAVDSEVVHNDVGTPAWSSSIEYGAGATVVYELNLYISQNDGNTGNIPDEESSVWWSLVQGGGGGGSTEKGAFRTFILGDGETTAFTCNHGLNTYLVSYFLYSTSGSMENRLTSFRRSSTNHVVVEFATAPAEDELTLVVYRPGLGPDTVVTMINGQTGDVTIDPIDLGCLSVDAQELTDAQKAQVLANIGLTGTVVYTSTEKEKLADIEEGAQVNVQSDWEQTDSTADDYIKNKPTLGTAASKDTGTASGNVPILDSSGKLPSSVIPSYALTEYMGTVSTVADLTALSDAEVGDWAVVTADSDPMAIGSYILTGTYSVASAWVQIVGPGKVVSVNGKTGVVVLDYDDVGAVPTGRTVNGKALTANITLDYSDVGAVPTARTVNGHALSSDVELTAEDVGAVPSVDGIVAGTYPKVTINSDGLVEEGTTLSASDIPSLPASKITSGTLAVARLPTGVGANTIVLIPAAGSAGQVLRLNSAGTGWEWYTPSSSSVAVFDGTIEGDGSTTVFTLTHGLSGVPAVTLIDPDGKVVTTSIVVDSSSIVVTFRTAPESGATYTVKAVA